MSPSNQKRTSTKAGVALTAEARTKLQQVADWIEADSKSTDPFRRVRFGGVNGIFVNDGTTWLSILGTIVQCYAPFKLKDAIKVCGSVYRVRWDRCSEPVMKILDITEDELLILLQYLYRNGSHASAMVRKLRTLK